MKKILFSFLVLGLISFAACKNEKKADKPEEPKTETPAKPEEGKTDAMMANDKDHVCTEKCKDGTHLYAHGEKGHTCTEACGAKM
ncbi:MAG: hypothetical protein ABL876_07235 [Chitinophagaceae bacterium]